MAHKNRFVDGLTKTAAAVSIVMATVRFIKLFQHETEIKKASKNRFANNLPKITAAAALFMAIVRFINSFKREIEIQSE